MSCCTIQLIDINAINEITGVSLQSDTEIINSIITSSQDMMLYSVLGKALYDDIIAAVTAGTPDACQEALICQIKPLLAWDIAKEWSIRSMALDTPSGLRVLNEPNSAPAAERLVNNITQSHSQKVTFYESKLRAFLNDNPTCYPLWKQSCSTLQNLPFSISVAARSLNMDWRLGWEKENKSDYKL
jgi:hypothetical protein